ncbi:putative cytokinetic ring protein SteA [Actinomadura meridiana]|uniref:Cytokinetic ring protein SteA n=1 Tax=Actinomadura meridiana TaxID=559626 RepID=A0ABP8BWK0_9ACTN
MNEPSPTSERRLRLTQRLPRRVLSLGLARDDGLPGVSGTVRLDRRTKDLTKRLQPGDVAVIDHVDLDRVSAEALVACEVGAVVNVAPSISGRYPNLGPQILLDADIPLVDDIGPEIFTKLREGDQVRVEGPAVHRVGGRDEDVVAKGTEQTPETVLAALTEAKAGLATQLEAFVANTMEYVKRERDLLIDGVGVPEVRTKLAGRHALIVVRGYHYREDIATLRPYIREYRPVLIGVDGGADALMEAGYRPDMIVGDMDSVSDDALTCGAEIVVHAYRDGRAPGLKRVHELGQEAVTFPATATSEDIAMLLADDKGATLIVAVGTHANMVEFLDKGRAGMASTFLTRLRVGSKLVDAKGVSRLYRSRISTWSLLFLVLGAFVAIVTAVAMSPAGDVISPLLADRWHAFVFWLTGLFT